MEEIKVSEMLQAESINKDDSVMIIQEGVNKKAGGSIQTATGTSLSLTSVADTCKVKSNSKNLFDKDTAPIQAWIFDTANTKIVASANGKSTYIPCKPSTIYTISKVADVRFQVATTSTTPAIDVAYSDYIENNTASSITITTGASANYLVIYYWHNSSTITEQAVLDTLQVEEGSTATSYNPYNTNIIVRTKNLITNIIEGYALSGNTGSIAENPERAVSDFIKVEGGETYTRSGYTTSGLVWYKADKTRISNDNSNPVTAPANAVYVRLGINTTADYSQAQFEKGTTATSYVKGKNQEISLTPQEEKIVFTYNTETNALSDGSVTIEYNTQSRLLNNNDTTAIKEYVDRTAEEIYSTEETKIGTFMGKPLYRKVFVINATIPSNSASSSGTVTIFNKSTYSADEVFIKSCRIDNSDNSVSIYVPYAGGQPRYIGISRISNTINVAFYNAFSNENVKITSIIEYTKTTD